MELLIKLASENLGVSRETACIILGAAIGFISAKVLQFRSSRVPPLTNAQITNYASALQVQANSAGGGSNAAFGSIKVNGQEMALTQEQLNQIASLLKGKNKIAAIKLLRSILPLDLAAAKSAIDDLD